MDFELSAEQELLRNAVFECASSLDQTNKFVDKWKQLSGIGIMGLAVENEYGGSGLGALDILVALESLGNGCEDNGLSFAVAAHTLSCVVPINKFGSDSQKQTLLPGLVNGSVIAANAMTESSSGSDVFKIGCTALKNGEFYTLNGIKSFISNSADANLALAYVSTNAEKGFFGGISAFIVNENQFIKGTSYKKMGLESCSLGEIIFNDSKVSADQMLGKEGGGAIIFNESMEWERICLAGIHLGAMQRVLLKTINFVKNRKSLGQNISKFQAVSHAVADMQTTLEVARSYTYKTAWMMDSNKNVSKEAAITKLFVSNTTKQFMLNAMQIFGGYGYIEDYGIEKEVRDALASTIYSGTSEIQKNIIASNLGL